MSSSYCLHVADKLNHAVTLTKSFMARFVKAEWSTTATARSASVLTNTVKISAELTKAVEITGEI